MAITGRHFESDEKMSIPMFGGWDMEKDILQESAHTSRCGAWCAHTSNRLGTLKDLVWVKVTRTQSEKDANKQQAQVYQPPHASRNQLAGYGFGSFMVWQQGKAICPGLILKLELRNVESERVGDASFAERMKKYGYQGRSRTRMIAMDAGDWG